MKAVILCWVIVASTLATVKANEGADPSDLWYRGFLQVQKSQEHEECGDFLSALSAAEQALDYLTSVSNGHPDYHPVLVKKRLQILAGKREQLKSQITAGGEKPEGDHDPDTMADEIARKKALIEQLEKKLETIRSRKELLEKKLEQMRKEKESGTKEDSNAGEADIRFTEPKDAVYILQDKIPAGIPSNWIPREYDGETTYIVPLIETNETRPFSKLTPAPAVFVVPAAGE
jgi:hypothetical protein